MRRGRHRSRCPRRGDPNERPRLWDCPSTVRNGHDAPVLTDAPHLLLTTLLAVLLVPMAIAAIHSRWRALRQELAALLPPSSPSSTSAAARR